MKTKWIMPALTTLALGATALAVIGRGGSANKRPGGRAPQYTCPMKEHADVVSDQPGQCPWCGMKLVEKK